MSKQDDSGSPLPPATYLTKTIFLQTTKSN
jgi:hypothetical protein